MITIVINLTVWQGVVFCLLTAGIAFLLRSH